MNDLTCLKSLRRELRDLDVHDVLQDFLHHRVFNNDELTEILNEPDETLRLDLMFINLEWKQQRDPQIVTRFMNSLRPYYDWIVELWEKNRNKETQEYKQYLSYRNETSMPSHDAISLYRKDLRWKIHKYLMSLRHGASEHRYLFIHGKMGTGKQTLVCQACDDITIVKRMDFKIFYLDLAYCRSKESILEMLEKLSVQFGESIKPEERGINYSYPSNMIDYWKRTFTRQFDKMFAESLLVLAHVRHEELINHFDFKCKTVVITSNKDVLREVSETEQFSVELPKGFTEEEGLELFARALKKKSTMLPSEATELCRACQGNPFLINLIALRMSEECKNEIPVNWQQHIDNLQNFSIGKSEKITRTIASTLDQFTEEEKQCFHDLVIFRDNVPLSQRVLEMYWEKDRQTTECILSKLERRGLLEKRACKNKMFYMMQYICYNEIKHPPGTDMKNLHRRLLNRYSIRENLNNRRELELHNEFPNDDYFHFYIAYHIEQADELTLFQELYQDFGFLEQKLRIAGLANTVGDLRKYQQYIFPTEEDKDSIIDTLIGFLMDAECLLSEDSRLLQRALNYSGKIADMAKLQIEKYKHRLWFRDVTHCFESSVVKLCHRPVKVRFQDSNHVFVSLAKKDIQLWNLTVEYGVEPMELTGCDGDQIVDMQKINQFLLALNRRGDIKVWSTKNLPESSDYRMLNSYSREPEMTLKITNGFSCFCVLKQNDRMELIAISESGVLCVYNVYTTVFRTDKPDIKLPTSIQNAYILLPLKDFENQRDISVNRCLFMTQGHGEPMAVIFNMRTTNVESRFVEPVALNVYQVPEGVIFVNERQIRFRAGGSFELGELVIVYETKHCNNTCSVLTEDRRYIVLGTERGISIINLKDGVEIRRMNISHSIVDLDVLMMEPSMSHVLLACISKDGENAMNLYSLFLATNNQVVSSQYQLEGTTVFLTRLNDNPVLLNTIDRHCKLLQTPLWDNDWGVQHESRFENEKIDALVHCLIKTPSAYYLGLENGKVLKMFSWDIDVVPEEIVHLHTEVTYLDYFPCDAYMTTSEILVVAGRGCCKIFINDRKETEIAETIRRCYLLHERFLLLIGERCSIQLYDLENKSLELVQKETERFYGASAYHQLPSPALILCTIDGIVYHLGLHQNAIKSFDLAPFDELLTVKPLHRTSTVICSCALSANGEFLAIGCCDGRIVLHQRESNRQLGVLDSHQFPVSELYFSHWSEPGSPNILISVGEQIVFWNVDYLSNNQPAESTSFVRRSGRFSTRKPIPESMLSPSDRRRSFGSNHSGFSTPVQGSPVQRSFFGERSEEWAHWYDKRGPSNKPYLLSCIKLIGRATRLIMNREFSEFLTMDDEGYIHFLRLYQPSSNHQLLSPPVTFGVRSPAATPQVIAVSSGTNVTHNLI
ncbi:uncharacterized protein LOC128727020 [Anopheles nili]|uniref:uncharacterized protein LOC128727020 n=1 Tax=Anopheles nili TaxID=185578 RepID=UPI00237B80F2|nr:uncharacterized protein LOC128727020 [Anopheles nili]